MSLKQQAQGIVMAKKETKTETIPLRQLMWTGEEEVVLSDLSKTNT